MLFCPSSFYPLCFGLYLALHARSSKFCIYGKLHRCAAFCCCSSPFAPSAYNAARIRYKCSDQTASHNHNCCVFHKLCKHLGKTHIHAPSLLHLQFVFMQRLRETASSGGCAVCIDLQSFKRSISYFVRSFLSFRISLTSKRPIPWRCEISSILLPVRYSSIISSIMHFHHPDFRPRILSIYMTIYSRTHMRKIVVLYHACTR